METGMKMAVFWNVASCRLPEYKNRIAGGSGLLLEPWHGNYLLSP
jgi:hypothetical protein